MTWAWTLVIGFNAGLLFVAALAVVAIVKASRGTR